ncbi:MAG: hypothetical protein NC541_13760 [bacterium]|nr:hypothetical protein [bacterium]
MKRKWIRLLAPLAVVLSVALALPLMSRAVDLTQTCKLTVNLTSSTDKELRADLESAGIIIEVYQIATAVSDTASDTYHFEALEAYRSLDLTDKAESDGWQAWQAQAQEAAKIALADNPDSNTVYNGLCGTVTMDTSDPTRPGNVITSLEPGLYLLIPHGKNLTPEQYKIFLDKDTEFYQNEQDENDKIVKGAGTLATVAYSAEYQYTFLPELVAVPNKGAAVAHPSTSAADRGPWQYDFEIYLKPAQTLRYGSLEIVKDLLTFESWAGENPEPATFVFSIEAVRGTDPAGNPINVYSDVVAMYFDAAGTQRVTIKDKIPAGSTVTVTEVYSGASYEVKTGPVWAGDKNVISATELISVKFTNDYDRRQTGGHGITNHFRYEPDGAGLSWNPTQYFGGAANPDETTTPGGTDNPDGTIPGGTDNSDETTPSESVSPDETTPSESANPDETTPSETTNSDETTSSEPVNSDETTNPDGMTNPDETR